MKGENFIQIGLNSAKPGGDDMTWMRANKIKYHFMGEIDKLGWKKVMDKVLAEIEDGPEYVYISIDTDVLDAAFAPGMGTPELGGMTIRELFPMLRATAIAKKVVGIELVEVNPVVDPTYLSAFTGLRILKETLTGMAMRKENSAALEGLTPASMPAVMVEPEREMPGVMARPWAIGSDEPSGPLETMTPGRENCAPCSSILAR